MSKYSGFRCSFHVPAEHCLPFHHLQELFHFVYATFRPHGPLFHQDPPYLASQPLIHTPGDTGTALITIHYGNVSLQTSRFDHQRLRGHRQVYSLWIRIFLLLFHTVLNSGCLNFFCELLDCTTMKFTARQGRREITIGAVSGTTTRRDSNRSSKTGLTTQKLSI